MHLSGMPRRGFARAERVRVPSDDAGRESDAGQGINHEQGYTAALIDFWHGTVQ